jgi:hypothetical protein
VPVLQIDTDLKARISLTDFSGKKSGHPKGKRDSKEERGKGVFITSMKC